MYWFFLSSMDQIGSFIRILTDRKARYAIIDFLNKKFAKKRASQSHRGFWQSILLEMWGGIDWSIETYQPVVIPFIEIP